MPQKKKSSGSKAKAARADKTSDASAKTSAPVGTTSGVGVNETWIRVFEKNEQGDESERLTDEQISEHMKSEFPDARLPMFDHVDIARGKYNRGGFHRKDKSGKTVRPKVRSKAQGFSNRSNASTDRFRGATGGIANKGGSAKHKKDFKSHKK